MHHSRCAHSSKDVNRIQERQGLYTYRPFYVGLQVWMAPNHIKAILKVLFSESALFKCFRRKEASPVDSRSR